MQKDSEIAPNTSNPALAQLPHNLQLGLGLHQAGQLTEAAAHYEKILTIQPRHADAINLLGAIAIQTRNPERAVELFSKAIEIDPDNVAAYCNSGWALREIKHWDAALARYDQAIALRADLAEAHFNRGNVLVELKHFDAALASLRQAIAIEPDYAEAHLVCGIVLEELKQWDAALACYDKAIDVVTDYEQAYLRRGNVLAQQKRFDDALASFDQAIALKPDYAQAHYGRGNVLAQQKRFDDARASFDQAIALKPDYAEAYFNRGNALYDLAQLERLGEALRSFDQAIALKPDFADAHANRGRVLYELGQWAAALHSINRAIELKPDYAEAHSNLGILLRSRNRPEEAEASLRRAYAINPSSASTIVALAQFPADRGQFAEAEELLKLAISLDTESPEALGEFVRLRKMTVSDAAWLARAQQLIAAEHLPPRKEAYMRKAIGKYLDDTRDFDQAFAQFQRANEIAKLTSPKYDRQSLTRTIDFILQSYDREWIRQTGINSNGSQCPVFIVGMPRSGTTLAEQILASHPDVLGVGEMDFWTRASKAHRSSVADGKMDDEMIKDLANDYLGLLKELSAGELRVIDKMPGNFAYLGLIHAALPKARIIHMQRNPIDSCLSMYFQNFTVEQPYAHDLEDLVHYCGEYRRLMQHWRSTLPADAILHVTYEELVEDQETWSRNMVEFIGLPWDPRCLEFHLTDRRVATASRWQVRQKIGRSSIERWRNYERFVGPLLQLIQ